jgi:hypothetical protein
MLEPIRNRLRALCAGALSDSHRGYQTKQTHNPFNLDDIPLNGNDIPSEEEDSDNEESDNDSNPPQIGERGGETW